MSLSHLSPFKKGDVKNKVKDKLSNTYFVQQKEIELYKNGTLYLPTLNVFANIEGNKIVLKAKQNVLDSVKQKALEFLCAQSKTETLALVEKLIEKNA